jgi:hypothetical protein
MAATISRVSVDRVRAGDEIWFGDSPGKYTIVNVQPGIDSFGHECIYELSDGDRVTVCKCMTIWKKV